MSIYNGRLLYPTLFSTQIVYINKSRISHIECNRVFINKAEIPIGSNYKEGFLKEIGLPG